MLPERTRVSTSDVVSEGNRWVLEPSNTNVPVMPAVRKSIAVLLPLEPSTMTVPVRLPGTTEETKPAGTAASSGTGSVKAGEAGELAGMKKSFVLTTPPENVRKLYVTDVTVGAAIPGATTGDALQEIFRMESPAPLADATKTPVGLTANVGPVIVVVWPSVLKSHELPA